MERREKFSASQQAFKIVSLASFLAISGADSTLGTVQFEAGEQILVSLWPLFGKRFYPYHVYFAASKTELLDIAGDALFSRHMRPQMTVRDELPDYLKSVSAKVVKPDPKRPRMDLNKAITLAWRMKGKLLPYNLFRCNCRHYCDYLTYGRTYGSKLNPAYMPMNSRCPLAVQITPSTDVADEGFTLRDESKHSFRLLRDPRIPK